MLRVEPMTAPIRELPPWLAAILPGLRGVPSASSSVAEWPTPLLSATVTTPANPVPTGLAPALAAGMSPANFRPTLVDLIPEVAMSGGVLQVPDLDVTGGAAPHAQGAPKTEAAMIFAGRSNKAASIATYIRASDELLDDVAGLESWLRVFLPFLVKVAEEKELLGDGTTSNIVGVFTPGLCPVYTGPATTVDEAIGGMLAQAATPGVMPDTIVLSAADWAKLSLQGGSARVDLAGGAYAGVDLVVSPNLVAGKIVVGPFQSLAAIGREGGILVEGTNSHASDFVSNISAVRAQSRIAFALLMTNAFVVKP